MSDSIERRLVDQLLVEMNSARRANTTEIISVLLWCLGVDELTASNMLAESAREIVEEASK